ncbi:zinc-binding alcohol dehydrogenase family protein [Sporomusa termitida]|uniref:Putative zinc-type alcohol dehydrogenase-like protein YjmD n=1 Tax=Sporomusa termitida TaxID=2377 RepID=A0A517DYI8_9FIRM|nr:zinc-binding alcohol dehydrogenase family protein [Sporomusa termitida]QDR82316.1 putative zinc-type alcohol dehydrogenase-like protein YjmD [Sporomusa termitida]
MQAVYLQNPGDIKIAEIEKPQRGRDELLIAVRSAGICGSDIGAYRGTNPLVSYPRIIGHEIAGEIIEIPADETNFAVGDRVILEPYVYCGHCYPCSIGHTNCCENLTVLGVHIDGGMAQYFSHPRHLVHKAPDDIPWDILPMAEPLVISMHAVTQPKTQAGEHVVITGCGPIGLLAAQYALTLGAIPIVVDPVEERLALARQLGIRHTVNPVAGDAVKEIQTITNQRMAEVVIEASGDARAIRSTIDYVSYAGRISFVGWPKNEIPLPTALFTKKELTIVGSRNSVGMFPESLRLIAGKKVDVAALVTKTVSVEEIPATVKDISEHPERYLKVIGLF